MASKGIDVQGYISSDKFKIEFECRGYDKPIVVNNPHEFKTGHFEMDSSNLGPFERSGRLHLKVYYNNKLIHHNWFEIAAFDGVVFDNNYERCYNIIPGICSISIGFANMASIVGTAHKLYVYVTEYRSSPSGWMKEFADVPLKRIFLPGSHDAGMIYSGSWLKYISPPDALAMTQKESIANQLAFGVRYFDFRPGYLPGTPKIYHYHSIIQGILLEDCVKAIVDFQKSVDKRDCYEVFVLCLSSSGVDVTVPSNDTLMSCVSNIVGRKFKIGNIEDMWKTPKQLKEENIQLILLFEQQLKCIDSYTDDDYKTDDPQSIKNALNKAFAEMKKSPSDKELVKFQLQGTPNGTQGGISLGVLGHSPLAFFKPAFTRDIFTFIASSSSAYIGNNYPTVLLDDFADNLLTDLCIRMTRRRLKQ